jgi:hypothetical protein
MTRVTRAHLRGSKLLPFCHFAQTTTGECGPHDNRTYCYGVRDKIDDELIEPCRECKANVIFATPLKGEEE